MTSQPVSQSDDCPSMWTFYANKTNHSLSQSEDIIFSFQIDQQNCSETLENWGKKFSIYGVKVFCQWKFGAKLQICWSGYVIWGIKFLPQAPQCRLKGGYCSNLGKNLPQFWRSTVLPSGIMCLLHKLLLIHYLDFSFIYARNDEMCIFYNR